LPSFTRDVRAGWWSVTTGQSC